MIKQSIITTQTKGRGFYEITPKLNQQIINSGICEGICHLFLQHTSAGIIICENADPSVKKDLENFFRELIPDNANLYNHSAEGDDDMPAHIRAILTKAELTLPITHQALNLGTWQDVYLWEHRKGAFTRKIIVTLLGE